MMEFLVDSLLMFLTMYGILTLMAWAIKRRANLDLDEVSQDLELQRLIPLTIEVVDNQYFCYNSITQDFVCQGTNLTGIARKFKQRYPDKAAAIFNGDETAVRALRSQLKELDENSSSVRYTS